MTGNELGMARSTTKAPSSCLLLPCACVCRWVLAERGSFGSGDYDFKAHNVHKLHEEYSNAEKRLEELKGKVRGLKLGRGGTHSML